MTGKALTQLEVLNASLAALSLKGFAALVEAMRAEQKNSNSHGGSDQDSYERQVDAALRCIVEGIGPKDLWKERTDAH